MLADFRSTFHLPAPLVATWRAAFLLDCVDPAAVAASGEDPGLTAACQLLAANVQPDTPFKFIEVLVSLGRADVALAVHRAQAGGSTAGYSLAQATTLLDLRLRCGLITEAFLMLRAHAVAQADPVQRSAHVRQLLRHLADWAVESSTKGQPQPWVASLMELPFNEQVSERNREAVCVCVGEYDVHVIWLQNL